MRPPLLTAVGLPSWVLVRHPGGGIPRLTSVSGGNYFKEKPICPKFQGQTLRKPGMSEKNHLQP